MCVRGDLSAAFGFAGSLWCVHAASMLISPKVPTMSYVVSYLPLCRFTHFGFWIRPHFWTVMVSGLHHTLCAGVYDVDTSPDAKLPHRPLSFNDFRLESIFVVREPAVGKHHPSYGHSAGLGLSSTRFAGGDIFP